jgi:aminoglycoside/choline kinase family phosphotransferase
MTHRAVEIAGFLAQNGWDGAAETALDADLSPRRYARLQRDDGKRAILMDADADQKTPDFLAVAKILRQCDISVPEIFAADPLLGLVLMEDFGGKNFARMIESGGDPRLYYRRAVDVLVHLHRTFDKSMARDADLPIFGGALFAAQVEIFLDAYFPYAKKREATHEEGESFRAAWKEVLRGIEALPQTLMLRDYMLDNLMDLPGREDWKSTGVLDFQDAGHGPIAYDLASLCEVVRRDGGDLLLDDMIATYHAGAKPALSVAELTTACHILSAQRHMRILGVLVAHAQRTGRTDKLPWLPRIEKYLRQLLRDDALRPMRDWMEKYGPLRLE